MTQVIFTETASRFLMHFVETSILKFSTPAQAPAGAVFCFILTVDILPSVMEIQQA